MEGGWREFGGSSRERDLILHDCVPRGRRTRGGEEGGVKKTKQKNKNKGRIRPRNMNSNTKNARTPLEVARRDRTDVPITSRGERTTASKGFPPPTTYQKEAGARAEADKGRHCSGGGRGAPANAYPHRPPVSPSTPLFTRASLTLERKASTYVRPVTRAGPFRVPRPRRLP